LLEFTICSHALNCHYGTQQASIVPAGNINHRASSRHTYLPSTYQSLAITQKCPMCVFRRCLTVLASVPAYFSQHDICIKMKYMTTKIATHHTDVWRVQYAGDFSLCRWSTLRISRFTLQ